MPRADKAMLLRASAAEVRRARAAVDLRLRVRKRRRTGRLPVELGPGVRRAILELHAEGVGYRAICRRLKLGVSYRVVRRVVQEICAMEAEARGRPLTVREMVKACDPGLLRRLRRAGLRLGAREWAPEVLERVRRDPVVADLLRDDRRGAWEVMVDGA